MLQNLKDLNLIFKKSGIKNYNFIFLLIFLNSIFELLSIGMLIPLIGSIINESFFDKVLYFLNEYKIFSEIELNTNDKKKILISLIFFILSVYIFKYILNLFFNHYLAKQKIFFEKKIAHKMIENIVSTTDFKFLNVPKSKILHDITVRLSSVSASIIYGANLAVETLILSIILILIIFSLGIKSFIYLFFIITISSFFFYFFKKKAIKWSMQRGIGGDQRSKNLLDLLEGIREVIIFGNSKYLFEEFKKNNNKFLDPLKKILFWNSVPKIILEFSFLFLFLIYFVYAINTQIDYQNFLTSIAIIFVILIRALPSINRILFNYSQLKYATEPINSIKNFLNHSKINTIHDGELKFENKIELKNIDFYYTQDKKLFENLSLNISKNNKVGIIGNTGTGKSTLVDIFSGLKAPTTGKILVDNKNLLNEDIKQWLKNIAYVSQRVYLFNTSIRNNITFAADDDQINNDLFNEIINLVDLKNLINEKNDKEYFNVGEFGMNISGGQRQKIGIARALYSTRPILIFDESTNSLDEKNEKKIIDQIINLNEKTILFITHKKENLDKFKIVYKIENTKLVKVK